MTLTHTLVILSALAVSVPGCKKDDKGSQGESGGSSGGGKVSGDVIKIDGSSTVFPITQAVAEEFQIDRGGRVTVGVSGTGGGFKKFCRGELAITGASRPVKASELKQCEKSGIELIELPVAYDGIAVVVNPDNDWVDHMTVEELKRLWEPEAADTITKWSQVRTGWPDKSIHLFAPGVDSGTYDYFTKAIVGKEQASRGDFTSSENDDVLVQGVSTDKAGLGYFGFAYYTENENKLKVVPIDDGNPENGDGPMAPSLDTVAKGTYQPLSRPVFIYVSMAAAERLEVDAFVRYYLTESAGLVEEVGYIPLPRDTYQLVLDRYDSKVTGTMFEGGATVGVTVGEMLKGS